MVRELQKENKAFKRGTWRWGDTKANGINGLGILVVCPSCGTVAEILYPGPGRVFTFHCTDLKNCGWAGEVKLV